MQESHDLTFVNPLYLSVWKCLSLSGNKAKDKCLHYGCKEIHGALRKHFLFIFVKKSWIQFKIRYIRPFYHQRFLSS
jgi:hypothetical protein